mmetsp:Transcript_5758/g.6404  ORF Transcript_5758/g.6404 Transcript_5758/m.6404 type:complete len:108 (+) Transcript_5758:109-432(+)
MLYFIHCHRGYDLDKKHGYEDCVMNEHDESSLNCCPGERAWDGYKYACCGTWEEDVGTDPCFKGSHISEYVDGRYWQDDQLEEINEDCICSTCNPQEKSSDDDGGDD